MTDKQLAVLVKSYRHRLSMIRERIKSDLDKLEGVEYEDYKGELDLSRPIMLNGLDSFIYSLSTDIDVLDD